jgi:hypothetical protein
MINGVGTRGSYGFGTHFITMVTRLVVPDRAIVFLTDENI